MGIMQQLPTAKVDKNTHPSKYHDMVLGSLMAF
jgi:hypothetical protein